ncbi:hypothetical protein H6G45_00485 [Synechocystis sp. FACHB-383]|jgi:hypothetical protein|uniref:hypothetical protein n=1 Tax=unclassified Synechocystis TaxID=2640012 RepID=UPI001683003F|nr:MULTISPECIES: hypothetical protein [unclassified Synechocystis]MBD2651989.1 hypothetical protein [Synechocystis sp. FACHB-383]MBE9193977.1 hypothetical protein [Synechocystis sp. LEGE 06083]
MVGAIALHLLINAKAGRFPLLLSMLTWQFHDQDNYKFWTNHLSQWWSGFQKGFWSTWFQSSPILMVLEMTILLSIIAAWIILLLK